MSTKDSRNPLRRLKLEFKALRARHEERHRPTGFGFALADRIDFVNAAHWDAVAAHGSVLLLRSVLRVIETDGPANVSPRYAIIFRDKQPVGILAVQIVTITGSQLHRRHQPKASVRTLAVVKRLLAPAVETASEHYQERVLVAGNLMSWGCHGVAFAPGEDPAELWRAVAEAIYRIRRAERLGGELDVAMVKDLTSTQVGVETLKRLSYRPLETEPNMVLAIDPAWRRYEDYAGALDAKNRRKIKDLEKKLAASGCSVERLQGDLSAEAVRLHELYLSVQGNATVRLVTLPPTYLPSLAAVLGEDFRCTVIRRAGEIVGFVSSVRDGDTAIGYYIGFDRAVAAEGAPLYLRLLHATVTDAIEWRCRRLSLGRTALEPKAGLGAKPEPMSVWVRHRVPALNWMLRGLLSAVPHVEAPERNPFKST